MSDTGPTGPVGFVDEPGPTRYCIEACKYYDSNWNYVDRSGMKTFCTNDDCGWEGKRVVTKWRSCQILKELLS